MQLVYQDEWVPIQPPKTIFQSNFKPPLDISKDWDVASENKVLWSPNQHIFKMAAKRILEMVITITQ